MPKTIEQIEALLNRGILPDGEEERKLLATKVSPKEQAARWLAGMHAENEKSFKQDVERFQSFIGPNFYKKYTSIEGSVAEEVDASIDVVLRYYPKIQKEIMLHNRGQRYGHTEAGLKNIDREFDLYSEQTGLFTGYPVFWESTLWNEKDNHGRHEVGNLPWNIDFQLIQHGGCGQREGVRFKCNERYCLVTIKYVSGEWDYDPSDNTSSGGKDGIISLAYQFHIPSVKMLVQHLCRWSEIRESRKTASGNGPGWRTDGGKFIPLHHFDHLSLLLKKP